MGSPLLRTASTASPGSVPRWMATVPPGSVYLQALSSSTATSRSRRVAFPRTEMPAATELSQAISRSKATASKESASPSTRRLRFTSGASSPAASSVAGRARSSISATRACMRSASTWVLSTHCIWLATVSPPRRRRMALFARITVRGVFSSWEASATNCCCWFQARCTGPRAQRENRRLSRNSSPRAITPMPASPQASPCHAFAAPPPAKATSHPGPTSRFEKNRRCSSR